MERKSDHGFRRLADEVRSRPLTEVAPLLGYAQDRTDRCRWKRPGSVLSISGPKYYDHIAGCGGGGAIDLVIHGLGCTPLEAINWLAGRPSPPGTARPPVPVRPRALAMPPPCEDRWDGVRAYLTGERGLDAARLDDLKRAGLLWADARLNAVFACRDARGQITGAELVGVRRFADGSRFRGMVPGSRKALGGFWFGSGDAGVPAGVFLAESAIDALSACALGAGGAAVMIYASVAGTCRRLPDWLGEFDLAFVICGFDADGPGDAAAGALIVSDRRVSRARPSGGEDWNALLQQHI